MDDPTSYDGMKQRMLIKWNANSASTSGCGESLGQFGHIGCIKQIMAESFVKREKKVKQLDTVEFLKECQVSHQPV